MLININLKEFIENDQPKKTEEFKVSEEEFVKLCKKHLEKEVKI